MNKALKIAAVFFLAAAAVCKFALVGFSFAAGCALAAAVLCLVYLFLNTRTSKAAARISAALTVVLAVLAVISVSIIAGVVSCYGGNADTACDYVVVLGAGVHGETPSASLSDRLERALKYMNAHPDAVAVVSGGQGSGEDITEAECMRQYLTAHGIADERIIKEERAKSTAENVQFSLDIIAEHGGGSVAVISSDYHMCRAKLMFRRAGVNVTCIAAKTSVPASRVVYTVREVPTIVVFALQGLGI